MSVGYERFSQRPVWVRGAIDLFAAERSNPNTVPTILGEVSFLISKRLTPPVTSYDPPLEFISLRNRGGFFLFPGQAKIPGQTTARELGPGQYQWTIESDYYQTLEMNELWPPAKTYDKTQDLKLMPGPAYPFPEFLTPQTDLIVTVVRGSVFTRAGSPIQNAEIELTKPALPATFTSFLKCKTNPRGEWVLSFIEKPIPPPGVPPPAPDFTKSRIHVKPPQGAEFDVDLEIKAGQDQSLKQTALRGRIVKPGGGSFAGVKITTSVAAGNSISKPDGQWIFYFDLSQINQPETDVTVTATSPAGQKKDVQTKIKPGLTVDVPAIELS